MSYIFSKFKILHLNKISVVISFDWKDPMVVNINPMTLALLQNCDWFELNQKLADLGRMHC